MDISIQLQENVSLSNTPAKKGPGPKTFMKEKERLPLWYQQDTQTAQISMLSK